MAATVTTTPCAYTACDFFDRSDTATTLGMTIALTGNNYSGQAEKGGAWQTDGMTWGISTNQSYVISPTGMGNYARVDNYAIPANHTVEIYVRAGNFDGQVGIISRASADWNTNMVWIGMDAGGNVEVWTLVNSTWTLVSSGTNTPAITYTVQRRLTAILSGTALTVQINGTLVPLSSSFTIANVTGADGIYIDTTGTTPPKIDSFTIS